MAASLTAVSLAVQYAAGVPAPGCPQLRTSLLTKNHKTRIMAANSNPEAGFLVSAPSKVLGSSRLSVKRDNSAVADAPVAPSLQSKIPKTTEVTINNYSDVPLTVLARKVWQGYPLYVPDVIGADTSASFTHKAESEGSIAGMQFQVDTDYSVVVSWSNTTDLINKVFGVIQPDTMVDWNEIVEQLDSSTWFSLSEKYNYGLFLSITPYSDKPSMTVDFYKYD